MASWDKFIAVYIMANRKNGTLYTGVTSDLLKRSWQHREGVFAGFSKKWGCTRLVWFEVHDLIAEAIRREKSIKSYRRRDKIRMIERFNPDWRDLYFDLLE
ncbi:MAG: GIY-YIG nuclease family protein [Hyphomonadaceae bacterium]|nr:GIY-YIG nuclease family protein [Hyphomonadaceae bacterium]